MSAEKKVPELRFKGFSGEWEEKKLSEITSKIGSGKTPRGGDSTYMYEGIPLIRSQNIYNNSVNLTNIAYIHPKTHKDMNNSIVLKNDVLLNITGASIGRSAVYSFSSEANVNQHVCIIRLREGYRSVFTQLHLSSTKGQHLIDNNQAGGAREGLNFQQISRMSFSFASTEEQTAIGNTFQKLDSLINQHQQKHGKLSNIKKAMLEKMFPKQGETTPEIRFKGFSGEWEKKELGSVTEVTMGQSPSGVNYTSNPNDFILVQGNADLKDGFVVPRVWTSEVTKTATKGALIFSVRAPVGEVGKTNYDVVLGRGVAAINANEFIFQQLKKLKLDNYWYKVSAGSTFDSISSTELASTFIWVSSAEEQAAIGNYFQKLDTLISQHQNQITKLNNIKQACLSKMFV